MIAVDYLFTSLCCSDSPWCLKTLKEMHGLLNTCHISLDNIQMTSRTVGIMALGINQLYQLVNGTNKSLTP